MLVSALTSLGDKKGIKKEDATEACPRENLSIKGCQRFFLVFFSVRANHYDPRILHVLKTVQPHRVRKMEIRRPDSLKSKVLATWRGILAFSLQHSIDDVVQVLTNTLDVCGYVLPKKGRYISS